MNTLIAPLATHTAPGINGSVIILESDVTTAATLSAVLRKKTGLMPRTAATAEDAETLLANNRNTVFNAVVAIEAEGANTFLQKLEVQSIPSVVYGTQITAEIRQGLSTIGVADMVFGSKEQLPTKVVESVAKLQRNSAIKILVADDSRSMRAAIKRYLTTRHYQVLEAKDGNEALNVLKTNPDIPLVITDNEMPNMDGYSLVREIRKTYDKEEMAVIGISAMNNSMLSVNFINEGANDFLKKPFVKEELYCRVDHNIDLLERIALIRDMSNKDPLTRLYNRRYFYDNCDALMEQAEEGGLNVAAAMLDIDFFKKFNDDYGHDMGDEVLVHVSSTIASAFPDNAIVSRFGGEEFCILYSHRPGEDIFAKFDKLRRDIEDLTVEHDGQTVKVTISIGACILPEKLGKMLSMADANLYAAKNRGRNRVVIE